MTDDIFSLRAIVMSPDHGPCELFKQAAAASSIPTEILDAADAVAAHHFLAEGADLAYIDGTLPLQQIIPVVAAAKAAAKPPFTVHLATGAGAPDFDCDALAGKPARLDQAKWLLGARCGYGCRATS